MLVFLKVTDYNKIVKKDKSARRWSVAMTEKKHAIKPYPLGAHPEDGAIRFAYASGKKDCGIILYDRESGKNYTKSRSAGKSGWEMSTANTWNWIHSRSDISSMKRNGSCRICMRGAS